MAKIVLLYAVAMVYATVRYVVFAPANLEHLPVFVLNKGMAMAAAFCFALAFWRQWRQQRGSPEGIEPAMWFRAGIFGVFAHVPMSLAILHPGYFKEFFAGDRLSFNGEAVFLFGALATGGIYLLSRTSWTALQRWWLSLATIAVLFSHTLCMGIARGLNINQSHAYLPPMWLLSLVGITLGAGFLLLSPPRRLTASTPEEGTRPTRDVPARESAPG
jgi:hypothetical protein